jgi:hypothetical protein
MEVSNTLVYCNMATLTVVKCFIVQAPGLFDLAAHTVPISQDWFDSKRASTIKLFTAVINSIL